MGFRPWRCLVDSPEIACGPPRRSEVLHTSVSAAHPRRQRHVIARTASRARCWTVVAVASIASQSPAPGLPRLAARSTAIVASDASRWRPAMRASSSASGASSQRPRNGTPAAWAAASISVRWRGSMKVASAITACPPLAVSRTSTGKRSEHRLARGVAVGRLRQPLLRRRAMLALADFVAAQHQRAGRVAEFRRQRARQRGLAGAGQAADRQHDRRRRAAGRPTRPTDSARRCRRCRVSPRHARAPWRAATGTPAARAVNAASPVRAT